MPDVVYSQIPFKDIFEHARDAAIFILDKEGNILHSNRGVERSYGYTEEDLKGKNFSILFTQEDLLKNKQFVELNNCIEQGAASDRNYIVHKDGSYIWTHGETIFTKDRNGEIRLVKIVYDINEQKALEISLMDSNTRLKGKKEKIDELNKELIQKNDSLKRINRDLETFAYTVSHDLKAPITNIESLVGVIQELLSKEIQNKAKEEVDLLFQSIDKFKNVIDELSESLKNKQQSNQEYKSIHFTEIIEEVKMSLHEQIEITKTVFVEDFGQAAFIKFSKKNLRSILYNIISNSIKYRSPERSPKIGLQTYRDDGFLVIKVTDNGLGMNQQMKEQIFDKYKRFHTHVEGTGLGMNIVKSIIENSGGKIEVESEEGKGTTFKIYFRQ